MSMSRWEKFTDWLWRNSPTGRAYIAGRQDGEDATHDAIERQGVVFKLGDVIDKDATQTAWCQHCAPVEAEPGQTYSIRWTVGGL